MSLYGIKKRYILPSTSLLLTSFMMKTFVQK
nr:MAG TPA: hypothetical protein [Caudoviricetes sp.]